MIYYKASIQAYGNYLYFHLRNAPTTSHIVGITDLSSTSVLAISPLTHTKSENLLAANVTSSFLFNSSSYIFGTEPGTSTSVTFTSTTTTDLFSFVTFANKIYYVSYPQNTFPINITFEAPCTPSLASSFDYSNSSALPSWITYVQNPLTSTQSI